MSERQYAHNRGRELDFRRDSIGDRKLLGGKKCVGEWHGQVSHAEGHPHWHPLLGHPGPFTLVMSDGRKLKVLLESPEGFFHGTDDQENGFPNW
jgi:hypothetical protein